VRAVSADSADSKGSNEAMVNAKEAELSAVTELAREEHTMT
jgi:hypothetical protein